MPPLGGWGAGGLGALAGRRTGDWGRGGWEIWIGVLAGMGERKTLAGIVYIKKL